MDKITNLKIRTYVKSDTEEIVKLVYETIHNINIYYYNQAQVEAWAPANMDMEAWLIRLANTFTYVAEQNGKIVGFSNLEDNGYIDCFYCHQDFIRQGIGTKILEHIEFKARFLNIEKLFTAASITAKPFFISHKFTVVRKQEVELRGQLFTNFLMEKLIS